jgi:hypothetical protein
MTTKPAARAPLYAACLLKLMREANPEDAALATLLAVGDVVLDCVTSGTSPPVVVGRFVLALPVITMSLADDVVTLAGGCVFEPGGVIRSLVEVLDPTGIVEDVGTPRIETVPARSIVEAAFTSALAVGGKPKTLQMFAMAPNVAVTDEHARSLAFTLVTDLADSRHRHKLGTHRH